MSEQAFFLYDLHLRTSPRQGMDDLVRKAADAGFRSLRRRTRGSGVLESLVMLPRGGLKMMKTYGALSTR